FSGNSVRSRIPASPFTTASQAAPEDNLGDRFAFLNGGYAPTATANNVRWNTVRTVRTQGGYEAPENKIAERYPFLEQTYPQRRPATGIVTARVHRTRSGV